MWVSNSQNNFAPFAGFMLKGYEKQHPVEHAAEEIDEAGEDAQAGVKTTGTKSDDVAL